MDDSGGARVAEPRTKTYRSEDEFLADEAQAIVHGWRVVARNLLPDGRVVATYQHGPAPQPPAAPPVTEPRRAHVTPATPAVRMPATERDAERMNMPLPVVHELERITGDSLADGELNLHFAWGSRAEGKALVGRLRIMQKELRILKRQVRERMADVRGDHVASRQGVQAGFVASMFGRQSATRDRINKRERSKLAEAQALGPWSNAANMIDRMLLTIDGAIVDVQANPEGD